MNPPVLPENGLVAYYTCDEGGGPTLHDSSGCGNHGTITGGCAFVKHGDGYALKLDGATGEIDAGDSPSLRISGDLTIEAWVRTSQVTNDDQLILGDTAGKAIERSFLFVNSKGTLKLEHGDGISSEILSTGQIIFNGQWQHVAVVAEFPDYYIFINGALFSRGKMSFDITPTPGFRCKLGGWWAGHFDGELDDIRLYKRALSADEITRHAGAPAALSPSLDLTAAASVVRGEIDADVLAVHVPTKGASLRLSLLTPGAAQPARQTVPMSETRPASARAVSTYAFQDVKMAEGDYIVTAELLDRDGAVLAAAKQVWHGADRPAWLGSKAGITDQVLPPWKPVTVEQRPAAHGKGEALDIHVWGRTYRFDNSLFPSQITTKGKQILARPIRVIVRANGRETTVRDCEVKLESHSPPAAIVTTSGHAGGLQVVARHRIEYDGLMRSDWQICSPESATIEALRFEVDVKAAHAEYLYYSPYYDDASVDPRVRPGRIPDTTYSRSFTPFIWFGDDERGVQWVCESARNWFNPDPHDVISISRGNNTVGLSLSLVGRPIELRPREPLSYTFGLQASPVKPIEKDGWDYRIASCAMVPYGHDYDVLTTKIGEVPLLDYYRTHGVKTLLIANWTDTMCYTSPVGHEQQLRDLVRECHACGIKVIPYFGFQVSELASEWPAFAQDIVAVPRLRQPDRYPNTEPQMVDVVCLRSVWQDFLAHTIAKLIDDYDIDGVYLDTTVMPFSCMNDAHGCGYVGADDRRHTDVPLFAARETLKRLYTIVKQRKPDGIVDAHVYDGMNLPALAFATSYWDGEQLAPAGDDPGAALALDRFRAEFMGVQWGVPADFLHYRFGDFTQSFALTLPHDVLVRCHAVNRDQFDLAAKLWQVAVDFGRREASFVPYWRNRAYLSASPEGVYVSLYIHHVNGVLAVISNLGPRTETARVQLNLAKLGWVGKTLSAKDALTDEPVPITDGATAFDLPSFGWRLVWVRTK